MPPPDSVKDFILALMHKKDQIGDMVQIIL